MKKFLSIIALIMALSLSVVCFASCNIFSKPEENTPATNDDANKVTVSWYQGSKLLKEEKIEKGSKVSSSAGSAAARGSTVASTVSITSSSAKIARGNAETSIRIESRIKTAVEIAKLYCHLGTMAETA